MIFTYLFIIVMIFLLITFIIHRERILESTAQWMGYRKGYDAGSKTAARNIRRRVEREMMRIHGEAHLVPGL